MILAPCVKSVYIWTGLKMYCIQPSIHHIYIYIYIKKTHTHTYFWHNKPVTRQLDMKKDIMVQYTRTTKITTKHKINQNLLGYLIIFMWEIKMVSYMDSRFGIDFSSSDFLVPYCQINYPMKYSILLQFENREISFLLIVLTRNIILTA